MIVDVAIINNIGGKYQAGLAGGSKVEAWHD